jgi:hypothetical protein
VLDTSTSLGPASALTRAPMCTPIPPMSSPRKFVSEAFVLTRPGMSAALPLGAAHIGGGRLASSRRNHFKLTSQALAMKARMSFGRQRTLATEAA